MTSAVLEIQPMSDERLYVIGDIHGCYDELMALESKIRRSAKRSKIKKYKIISVGDLCDRGPDTKKVIEHFLTGKAEGTHDFVLGNHEMFFMLAFWGLRPDLLKQADINLNWVHHALSDIYKSVKLQVQSWRMNGGEHVFRSYDADINDLSTWERIPLGHLSLLFAAPLAVVSPTAIITHAVLHEGDLDVLKERDAGSRKTDKKVLEALHRCLWEREFPERKIDADRRHISGHTPTETVVREANLGVFQIDTGAVYGKKLTAINLENFRVISVNSSFTYQRRMGQDE